MSEAIIAAVVARDAERAAATIAGDVNKLSDYLADTLRYTHSSAVAESKAEYLGKLGNGFYKYTGFTDKGRQFQVHGDTVLVAGDVLIQVTVNGSPKQVNSRYLAAWVKQGGQWRMTAWQSTPIPA